LQGFADMNDLYSGTVAQLYLAGGPSQVYLRGRFLLVLTRSGNVLVIDCVNPRAPKISGSLPYHQVQQMVMQGDFAYLLLKSHEAYQGTLIVADLENPLKPREVSQSRLPVESRSFFLSGRQLVVYAGTKGYQGGHSTHLYDFTEDFQPVPLGSVTNPPLETDFLKYDRFLLVPDLRSGLNVVDVGDPLHPVVVASLVFPDQVKRLSRQGSMVFALGGNNRIYAINFHDPLHPLLTAVVEGMNYSAGFMQLDQYFYYFTSNGFLRVFDSPSYTHASDDSRWPAGIAGELMPTQTGDGFVLLGNPQESLPAVVTDVLTLPGQANVVDQLFWQGFLVILDDEGLVRFFRKEEHEPLKLGDSLQLSPGQLWVTASDDRLYVGGAASISIIAKSDDGRFALSGQVEYSGEESWDGLVVRQALCVAAGKEGVACFSVARPDQPTAGPGWVIPEHLESRVHVRQLASPGGGRLLAAAGPVGLLSGQVGDDGQLQFDGFLGSPAPLTTLAVVGDFCLASTGAEVRVIDIKNLDSLQTLGAISFPGVTAFAVAAPDFWAGYVPGTGWSVLPAPRLLLPGEAEHLQAGGETALTEPLRARYRLSLFNDQEVIAVPGRWALSSLSGDRTTGAAHGLQ
jgi:hypothetical protein